MNNKNIMQRLITYNGKHYILTSDEYEPYDVFLQRSMFIVKYINDKKEKYNNFDYVITQSRLWINNKMLGAIY